MHGKFHALDVGEISLWHPIGCDVAKVLAWRERLNALGIVQPFKQAHREVYLITDAERRRDLYSNRFADHIVKQHQMQALARLSGWSKKVQVGYDGGMGKYPARLPLPRHGLVAEYWVEGTGEEYTDQGSFLYLANDQLRFKRPTDPASVAKASGSWRDLVGETVRIADVPPLVLSEIMRHCDLFVGVA